jgi:hypothetical protein
MYNPIWVKLKKEHTVSLKVAPHHVATVKKAVTKEKYIDLGYKFQGHENPCEAMKLQSSYDINSWVLTFWLVSETRYKVSILG